MSIYTIPAPDAPAEEWGRLAVSLPGWRWMPGILAGPRSHPKERWLICWADQQYTKTPDGWTGPHGWEGGGYKVDNGKVWRIGHSGGDPIDLSGDGWFPDPDDPATAGCLLALLGERECPQRRPGGLWVVTTGGVRPIIAAGSVLGRVCIAAAAAIGRWPGGAG